MKLRIADRIIAAVTGVILIAVCASLIATVFFGVGIPEKVTAVLDNTSLKVRALVILAAAVTAFLGVYNILVLFRHRRRSDKFVTVKTEDGEITIAGKTIENMITRCTDQHDELSVSSVKLKNEKNGLRITLRGKVSGGVSIPLTVSALQKQIRQYVTACSGLEVKEILFRIDGPGTDTEKAAFTVDTPTASLKTGMTETARIQPEHTSTEKSTEPTEYTVKTESTEIPAEVQDDDRPLHQRIFCTPDEPCIVPPPPAAGTVTANEESNEKEEAVNDATEVRDTAPVTASPDDVMTVDDNENTEYSDTVEDEIPQGANGEFDGESEASDVTNDGFVEAQNLFDELLTAGQPE